MFIRPQKRLIVGPKRGLTYFLAWLAALPIQLFKITGPLACVITLAQLITLVRHRRFTLLSNYPRLATLFTLAWSVEAAHYLQTRAQVARLQRRLPASRVPSLSASERTVLFERVMRTITSPHEFIESWFAPNVGHNVSFSELGRANVEELLSWALFHTPIPASLSPADREQLAWMLSRVEEKTGPIKPGRNEAARMLKFTEEPVKAVHRPLVVYAVVDGLFQTLMVPALMIGAGYQSVRHGKLQGFYRPGTNSLLPPVCFIHGIGVGILPYQNFLRKLEKRCDVSGCALIAIHLPVISQRYNPDDLHQFDLVPAVRRLLESRQHAQAFFVGHSYGTFVAAWLATQASDLVAGLGLIDPVCLLLHSTDVLHNIIYHQPVENDAVETVLDYIMRSEVGLEHHLKRDFYWFSNVLFFEDVPTGRVPVFVVLGDNDQLVPVKQIREYIGRYNAGDVIDLPSKPSASPRGQIELLWFDRCDHAGFIFNDGFENAVCDAIERGLSKLC